MGEFFRTYGKTIVPALGTVVAAVQGAFSEGRITPNEYFKIGTLAVVTLVTYFAPARTNQPPLDTSRRRGTSTLP